MSVSHRAPAHPALPALKILALAALLAATAGAAANPPQIKPMRMGSGHETRAVRVDMTAADAKGDERPAARAATAAEAPPAAAVDPLEGLRQRLAGRLARQTLHDEAANPYDLKVVARTQPAPAAPSARSAARSARPPAPATPPAHVHWGYQGDGGPQAWARLRPEFNLCGKGQRQSPVDIRGGLAVDLEPVQFGYAETRFAVIDNGHTVQANIAPGSHIEVGGQRFELLNMHFHRPSEERIDGRQFEMSVHLVHRDAQGNLAVVALLIDRGPAHPVVQTVWNNLPLEQGQELPARVALPLQALLPEDRRYFTYMGSLTTPPCTEGVRWVVMRQPVSMSAEQIELFARIYPMNARPLQQLAGRRILQSQ